MTIKYRALFLIEAKNDLVLAILSDFINYFDVVVTNNSNDALVMLNEKQFFVFVSDHRNFINNFSLFTTAKNKYKDILNLLIVDLSNSNSKEILNSLLDNSLYGLINSTYDKFYIHELIQNLIAIIDKSSKTNINLTQNNHKNTIKYTIAALTSALDAKCGYTAGHSLRVGKLAIFIGTALNMQNDELYDLALGGVLHDIGKIGVPEAILWKDSKLDVQEKKLMDKHPVTSAQIVGCLDKLDKVRDFVLHHHEFIDGSGYPDNLTNENIPLGSRIILVADAYDAMTSDRPYRKALGHDKALQELEKHKGSQFDQAVVDAFIKALNQQKNFNVDNLPLNILTD